MKRLLFCAAAAVAIEFFALQSMQEQPQPVPAQAAPTQQAESEMNSPMHDEHVRRAIFQPSEHYSGQGPRYVVYTEGAVQETRTENQKSESSTARETRRLKERLEYLKANEELMKLKATPVKLETSSAKHEYHNRDYIDGFADDYIEIVRASH